MCIILVCPPGKTPDMDMITACNRQNPDGSGWAMRTPNGLEVVRSARGVDHVVGSFFACRERFPQTWAVFHARIATHGTIDDRNTHPFIVPGRPWALAHNGMMPLSDGPFIRGAGRSDSRILAEDHVSQMTWADMRAEQKTFEYWLQGDKVVLISENKEKGGPVLIFNSGLGKWVDGIWYSHAPPSTALYSRTTWQDAWEDYEWAADTLPALTRGK